MRAYFIVAALTAVKAQQENDTFTGDSFKMALDTDLAHPGHDHSANGAVRRYVVPLDAVRYPADHDYYGEDRYAGNHGEQNYYNSDEDYYGDYRHEGGHGYHDSYHQPYSYEHEYDQRPSYYEAVHEDVPVHHQFSEKHDSKRIDERRTVADPHEIDHPHFEETARYYREATHPTYHHEVLPATH